MSVGDITNFPFDEDTDEYMGVQNPMEALAIEVWAIVFTLATNTAFFFESKETFELANVYSGEKAKLNRWIIGLDSF